MSDSDGYDPRSFILRLSSLSPNELTRSPTPGMTASVSHSPRSDSTTSETSQRGAALASPRAKWATNAAKALIDSISMFCRDRQRKLGLKLLLLMNLGRVLDMFVGIVRRFPGPRTRSFRRTLGMR